MAPPALQSACIGNPEASFSSGWGVCCAHTRSLSTELARADGASLNLTHAAPPPSVTFPFRPVFAGCRKKDGDWLQRRECRSGGTGANTSIVEQPERWGFSTGCVRAPPGCGQTHIWVMLTGILGRFEGCCLKNLCLIPDCCTHCSDFLSFFFRQSGPWGQHVFIFKKTPAAFGGNLFFTMGLAGFRM